MYTANAAIASKNEADAISTTQKQVQLCKDLLTAMEQYENEIVRLRKQTTSEQTSIWRSAVKIMLSKDLFYQNQTTEYYHACINEIRSIQKNYGLGNITYTQYTEQINTVYVTYGRLSDTAFVRQDQAVLQQVI